LKLWRMENPPYNSSQMTWSQDRALSRVSTLTDVSGQVLARLHFTSRWKHGAVGQFGAKSYRFEYHGILRPTIRMVKVDLGDQIASIRLRWKMNEKAGIELADGRVFRLFCYGLISRTWKLKDESDRELCIMVEKWGLARSRGQFAASDLRRADPEMLFLALLVWYVIMVITYQESAAGVS